MYNASLTPAQPTVNDMIGATVKFRHENSFLYPGIHEGTVTAYTEDKRGDGWLTVKCPKFSIEKQVHESYVKGWSRPALTPVQAAPIQKTVAA